MIDTRDTSGCTNIQELPSGEAVAIFPHSNGECLLVGLTKFGYRVRYCYRHYDEVLSALSSWDGRDDPPGPWVSALGHDLYGNLISSSISKK